MMMIEEPPLVAPPLEDRLDLHRFQPREVAALLNDYLEAAATAGYREVLIIHGKGRGVLKHRVQTLLARHPLTTRFRDAPPELGGWGATVVTLATATQQSATGFSALQPRTLGTGSQGGLRWSRPARLLLGFLLGLLGAVLLLQLIR